MQQEEARAERPGLSGFVRRLAAAGSSLGIQLSRASHLSLRQYLASVMPAAPGPCPRHRVIAAEALCRYLDLRGDSRAEAAAAHLLSFPIVQQADHSNLLLDTETFVNNYFFHLSCRSASVRTLISSQCSTVSCLSGRQPVRGPVFLRSRGTLYQVLVGSKRMFKDSSFCGLPEPQIAIFRPVAAEEPETGSDDRLLGRLTGIRGPSAPDLYRTCNRIIWEDVVSEPTDLVGVDERWTSEIVARELEDASGPIRRLLYDAPVRRSFLRIKRELVASPRNLAVNLPTPDFFWMRNGSQLTPLRVTDTDDGELVFQSECGRHTLRDTKPPDLARALRHGDLYADRILAYTCRCLLPQIVALGGSSQQDYVALYQELLRITNEQQPFLEASEAHGVCRPELSVLGGLPLVELDSAGRKAFARLGLDRSYEEVIARFLDLPIAETVGDLSCAGYLEGPLRRLEATWNDVRLNQMAAGQAFCNNRGEESP